jgi:hypothetical protein
MVFIKSYYALQFINIIKILIMRLYYNLVSITLKIRFNKKVNK